MKRVLFLVNTGKISSNESGGASVYLSHLDILHKIGCEIVLLAIQWNENDRLQIEDYQEIKDKLSEVITYKVHKTQPSNSFSRVYEAIVNPSKFEYSFLNQSNHNFLQEIINTKNIDVVWAEWRWTAILALHSNLHKPVVYAHHDWEYKLAKVRKKQSLIEKFHTYQKKRVEFQLVKTANLTVSGSFTEVEEINKISSNKGLYLPTTYLNIENKITQTKVPSIIHLGGMNTTANRIGLERFLDVCWPSIKQSLPNIRLKVIGSLSMAPGSLKEKLNDSNIECFGFVKDLDAVLFAEDIHIIPWEYNTGTRTRVPVILNYQQALVATKASVSCFPEINNSNSVLCDKLSDMIPAIINLYSDRERLHLLSVKGKQTFLHSFVSESQESKLKNRILEL